MSVVKCIVEIQEYTDETGAYVRLVSDGHEIDRWGPFEPATAKATATKMGEMVKQFARDNGY